MIKNKVILIGLTGAQGSGKDTVADILVKNEGFVRRGFADPLYEQASTAFNVTVDFMKNRDTKETPLDVLSLQHCLDSQFIDAYKNLFNKNITDKMPISPRNILRCWGGEYRRIYSGNDAYWIENITQWIGESGVQRVAVPDVRYNNNEAPFIHSFKLGSIWHIDASKRGIVALKDHASDLGVDFLTGVDRHVDNCGEQSTLEDKVNILIKDYLKMKFTPKL